MSENTLPVSLTDLLRKQLESLAQAAVDDVVLRLGINQLGDRRRFKVSVDVHLYEVLDTDVVVQS